MPAATASIIVAAAPLVSVAIATLFLGEQLTLARVVGSAVAIGGVVAVSLARSGATVTSALLIAVGAAVVQGIYHPLIKPLLRDRSGLEVATYAMVAGTIMSLPLLPWGWHDMVAAPASAWGSALFLGLLPSALGFVLWGYAVANLPVATSTSLLYLVPAFAVLIGFVWLGEVPLIGELLGGLAAAAETTIRHGGGQTAASARRATMSNVPRISQFYGIAIYMYFSDHPPPHIHAQYGGVEAVIAISDGAVIRGSIPDRALRLVREWLELHREEVEVNWRLAATPASLNAIDPLP